MYVDDVEPRNKGEQGRPRDRAVFVGYLKSRDAYGMVEVETKESKNFALEENLRTEEQLRQNWAMFARKIPARAMIVRRGASKLRITNNNPLKPAFPAGARKMNQYLLFSNPNYKGWAHLGSWKQKLGAFRENGDQSTKEKGCCLCRHPSGWL